MACSPVRAPGGRGGAAGLTPVGGLQFRDGVGARGDPHRIRVGAGRADAVQLRVADADLFGQPLGRDSRGLLPGRVQAEGLDGGQPLGGDRGGEALGVAVAPQGAQAGYGDEAFRDAGGEADPGERAGVLVAEEARVPLGAVLDVRAVERLQLPPAGEEEKELAPQFEDGAGADPAALLEGGAEDGEVEGDPAYAEAGGGGAELRDHELHDPVGGGAVAAHQVEGDAVVAPGDEGEQGDQLAPVVEGLDQQAVPVGAVAEPVQGHGEAALGLGVAPFVGAFDDPLHLVLGEGGVAADDGGGPGAPDPVDGLPGDAHVAAVEVEVGHVQDGLVAELQCAETGTAVGGGALLGGTHDGGLPAVAPGHGQPGVDGGGPGGGVADRVPAGEADTRLDAVGHAGLAVGGEDDGLVAPGGEVAEGVVASVGAEEGADAGLLVAVQGGGQTLGAEEGHGCVQQGGGAEEAEQEGERPGWVAVELPGREETAEDLLGGPVEPLPLGQGAGEEGDERPAREYGGEQADPEDEQGVPQGPGAGGCVELVAGGDQHGHRRDRDDHGRDADPVLADGHLQHVVDDEQGQIGDDDPPGDLLAGAEGGREEEEEDGVGEVRADRYDDQVEEPHDVPQEPPQRGREREQGAEQAERSEERAEPVGHPVQEAVPGSVLLLHGCAGGTHGSHCREGGARARAEREG